MDPFEDIREKYKRLISDPVEFLKNKTKDEVNELLEMLYKDYYGFYRTWAITGQDVKSIEFFRMLVEFSNARKNLEAAEKNEVFSLFSPLFSHVEPLRGFH